MQVYKYSLVKYDMLSFSIIANRTSFVICNVNFLFQEEQDAVELTIVRTGSALVERQIEYYVDPSGDSELYGDTNLVVFGPGEVEKTIVLIARGDGIPEVKIM